MIPDREMDEYRIFHATLASLQEKFLKRKLELRRLLEETLVLKKNAYQCIEKANRLTRHLNGRQRQAAGLSYHLNEITYRINQLNKSYPVLFKEETQAAETVPEIREDFRSHYELKKKALVLLGLIDRMKKSLLQLDLLEMRCRELIVSINKALEAFRHEVILIRRKIYPYGCFSFLFRSLRGLLGRGYFSFRDMEEIAALGKITGLALKIADSPII